MNNPFSIFLKHGKQFFSFVAAFYLVLPPVSVIPFSSVTADSDKNLNVNADVKIWDFSTASDYNFDASKIEVVSGNAELKANLPENWFDQNWNYRRQILINNFQNPTELKDFQLEIKLDSTNFDFSKIRTDGVDIRITANDGVTPLNFWVEHFDYLNRKIFILVKVPVIPAHNQQTIYIYYGNKSGVLNSLSNLDGTLFTTNLPGIKSIMNFSGFNAFPGLEKVNNKLLATFRRGSAHLSDDGKIMSVNSTDNGDSWSVASLVYDDPTIDDRTDLGLKRLSSGILLQPFYKYSSTGKPASFLIKSVDGGSTWDSPISINVENFDWLAVYGKIIELDNGDLLLPAYGVFLNETVTKSVILQSTNNGLSWFLRSVVAGNERNSFNEASVLKLSGSNYLAIVRNSTSSYSELYKTVSSDDGNTWSEPELMFDGASPDLIKLNNGDILFSSVDRFDISGIRVQISHDNGLTWANARLLDKDYFVQDLGYPASIESDGRIVSVYYKEGQGIKNLNYTEDFIISNPNYNNFFDGLENNELDFWRVWKRLGGWGMFAVSDSIKHSGNYSLSITDLLDYAQPTILRSFDFGQKTGVVSFWIYPETINRAFEFGFLSGYSNGYNFLDKKFWIRISHSGFIEYLANQDEGIWARLPNSPMIETGTWAKIEMRFNNSSNMLDLFINGERVGTIYAATANAEINYLGFSIGSAENIGDKIYIDDIYTHQYSNFYPSVQFGSEEAKYPIDDPSIRPVSNYLRDIYSFYSFAETAQKNEGEIKYQLSNNNGNSWLWFNGSGWTQTVSGYNEANTAVEINSRIRSFPPGTGNFIFKAFLHSDGGQQVFLDELRVKYFKRAPAHSVPFSD